MDDDMEIERMLEERMQEDVQKKEPKPIKIQNEEKKDKDKDKDKDKKHKKHHKHHKHHKSHKNDKKHERKRSRSPRHSRSPNNRRVRTPTPPVLPSGKKRDTNSELHQLAKSMNRQKQTNDNLAASKLGRREKSPELTPEERDLRTVFCKNKFLFKKPRIKGEDKLRGCII